MASAQLWQQIIHRGAIATSTLEVLAKAARQGILIDLSILHQHFDNREGHLGVISVAPASGGKRTLRQWHRKDVSLKCANVEEDPIAKRIADGQAIEGC